MNCKKCGYPLVSGQTICSNCDEYNEREVRVNNFQSTENYSNEINNVVNYNTNSYNEYSEVEVEKKSFPKWIIAVIVAIIFVPLVVLGLIFAISNVAISPELSKEGNNSFIDTYRMLHKQVLVNNAVGVIVNCDGDCHLIYDYDEESIDLEIEDKGSYYEIEFEAKDNGKYNNVNLILINRLYKIYFMCLLLGFLILKCNNLLYIV